MWDAEGEGKNGARSKHPDASAFFQGVVTEKTDLWGGPWLPRESFIKGAKREKEKGKEGHGMPCGPSHILSRKGGGVGGLFLSLQS